MSGEQSAYDDWHVGRGVNIASDEVWHRNIIDASSTSDFVGKSVLEIGCGRGGFALWLASSSFPPAKLIAVDYSSEAIRQAQVAASALSTKTQISFEQGDIMAIDFPEATFDTVISCETIEHVPDPRKAVLELARVLKPGGRLLLTTPNYLNLFGIWRVYRWLVGRPYTEAGQPINKFVILPNTLSWVRQAGVQIDSYGSSEFLIPRFRRPPAHFTPHPTIAPLARYFGLQSFVVGRKPAV